MEGRLGLSSDAFEICGCLRRGERVWLSARALYQIRLFAGKAQRLHIRYHRPSMGFYGLCGSAGALCDYYWLRAGNRRLQY